MEDLSNYINENIKKIKFNVYYQTPYDGDFPKEFNNICKRMMIYEKVLKGTLELTPTEVKQYFKRKKKVFDTFEGSQLPLSLSTNKKFNDFSNKLGFSNKEIYIYYFKDKNAADEITDKYHIWCTEDPHYFCEEVV